MFSRNIIFGIGAVAVYGLVTVYWNVTPKERLEKLATKYKLSDVQKKFLYDCDYVFEPSNLRKRRNYTPENCACLAHELAKRNIKSDVELTYINSFQGVMKSVYYQDTAEKHANKNNISSSKQSILRDKMKKSHHICKIRL